MLTPRLLAAVLLQGALTAGPACAQLAPDAVDPAFIDAWLTQALASPSADERLVGAMMADYYDHALFPQFIDRSVADDNTALWAGLVAGRCMDDPTLSACADTAALDTFIAADPDNIYPHLLRMQWLLQQDDSDAALRALASGLSTTDTDDHYWQRLALLRATLRTSALPFDKLNLAAEAWAAPLPLYAMYNQVMLACRERDAVEQEWADACMALGIRLEASGTSWFATVFGASIQRDVLQDTDPASTELPAILARRTYYDDIRTTAGNMLDWWLDDSFSSKPEQFYADALAFGELKAIELALERAALP